MGIQVSPQEMVTSSFQILFDAIVQYRDTNVDCTTADLRRMATEHMDTSGYMLTFGEAREIDEYLFGDLAIGNTHWMEPFNFPDDGQVIAHENEEYVARDCALFTFKLV